MKISKSLLIASIVFLSQVRSFGQRVHETNIDVAHNKTTTLVFPFAVRSVDRGSKDILAQKVKGVENVLQLKAGRQEFSETNLTVITSDGKVHLFTINYSADPKTEALIIPPGFSSASIQSIYFSDNINDQILTEDSENVLAASSRTMKLKKKYKIKLSLKGIFIHGDFIFFRVQVNNASNIGYDIRSLRFYIRDKQKVKRTAIQETEMIPIYIHNQSFEVRSNSKTEMVYALPKFTIPDAKALSIELNEANGGRHLMLNIGNNTIIGAKAITQ